MATVYLITLVFNAAAAASDRFYKITKSIYTVTFTSEVIACRKEDDFNRTVCFAYSVCSFNSAHTRHIYVKENYIIFVVFKLCDKTFGIGKVGYCNVDISFGKIFVKVIYKRFSADG